MGKLKGWIMECQIEYASDLYVDEINTFHRRVENVGEIQHVRDTDGLDLSDDQLEEIYQQMWGF